MPVVLLLHDLARYISSAESESQSKSQRQRAEQNGERRPDQFGRNPYLLKTSSDRKDQYRRPTQRPENPNQPCVMF